jgi:hypothetical protein
VQALVDEQDTLRSTVGPVREGSGEERIAHRLPFHCSASGLESLPPCGWQLDERALWWCSRDPERVALGHRAAAVVMLDTASVSRPRHWPARQAQAEQRLRR